MRIADKVAVGLVIIALGASPLPAQTIALPKADVDYDKAVDFGAFRNYRWKDTQERLPKLERHTAMVAAIERELARKGLTKATGGDADLLVQFHGRLEEHLRGSRRQSESWSGDLRTSVDIEKMAEGTVVIELYTAKPERRVWRGAISRALRASAVDEEAIRSAVAIILRGYPPKPAQP
jgi:hypothetical protein